MKNKTKNLLLYLILTSINENTFEYLEIEFLNINYITIGRNSGNLLNLFYSYSSLLILMERFSTSRDDDNDKSFKEHIILFYLVRTMQHIRK